VRLRALAALLSVRLISNRPIRPSLKNANVLGVKYVFGLQEGKQMSVNMVRSNYFFMPRDICTLHLRFYISGRTPAHAAIYHYNMISLYPIFGSSSSERY
jgi:hypothetical protein